MAKTTHSYEDFYIEIDEESGSRRFVFKMAEKMAERLVNWSQERINKFQYNHFVEYQYKKATYNEFCEIDSVWSNVSSEGYTLPHYLESIELLKTGLNERDILLFSKSPSRWRVLLGNPSELMIYNISTTQFCNYNEAIRNMVDDLFDRHRENENLKKLQKVTEEAKIKNENVNSRIEEILGDTK